jgi:hypothetical protein
MRYRSVYGVHSTDKEIESLTVLDRIEKLTMDCIRNLKTNTLRDFPSTIEDQLKTSNLDAEELYQVLSKLRESVFDEFKQQERGKCAVWRVTLNSLFLLSRYVSTVFEKRIQEYLFICV